MDIHKLAIASQTSYVVYQASQEGPGVLLSIEQKLRALRIPGLTLRQDSLTPGTIKGLFGNRRDCLVVSFGGKLNEYSVLVSCRPFGTALGIVRYLVASAKFLQDAQRALRLAESHDQPFLIGSELDTLALGDLSSQIQIVYDTIALVIKDLAEEVGSALPARTPETDLGLFAVPGS